MDESVFKTKLEFSSYVEKRLLEVTDLQQRRQLRESLNHVFFHLYEHVELEYQALEQRILMEQDSSNRNAAVYTSIVPRNLYDATDEYLVPMDARDVEKPQVEMSELVKCIEHQKSYQLYRILLEADYQVVQALEQENRRFRGTLITDQGRFDAVFLVEKDDYYLSLIRQLYPIFINNYIPWSTICAPYLNKIFKVSLISVENWDKDVEILEVQVDFEEYEKFVRYDCIPVWNISRHIEKSSSYPEPCLDHIHYKHVVFRHRLEDEADYLVGSVDFQLTNIKRVNGDLVITCEEEYPVKWMLYKLCKPMGRNYPYGVFSNKVRGDFSDILNHSYHTSIKTEAELERFISSQGYQEILKYSGYSLVEGPVKAESYQLDAFIEDEFQTAGRRLTMVLEFQPEHSENILNRDIMSYFVTQVQKKFPEYHCIGRLK